MSPEFGKTHATSPLTCVSVLPATGVCSGQKDLDKDLEPALGKVQAMGPSSGKVHEVSLQHGTDLIQSSLHNRVAPTQASFNSRVGCDPVLASSCATLDHAPAMIDFDTIVSPGSGVSITSASYCCTNRHMPTGDTHCSGIGSVFYLASDAYTSSAMHTCIDSPCWGAGAHSVALDTIVPSGGDTSTS